MDAENLRCELLGKLNASWHGLSDKPDETPESTLEELWDLVAGKETALPADGDLKLRALVERRLAGEPLSYLTGRQCFMGLELLAAPGAMIPRKETEILARAALDRLTRIVDQQGSALVVDVCTGSGNIALTLARNEGRCLVHGSDISEEAVELARRNAAHLGLEPRVSFRSGDFLEPFKTPEFMASVDLLTCNPPYISSAKVDRMDREIAGFEPRAAFDGGPFGISILNRLVKEAPVLLKEGGWVACETGLGQGEAMSRLFRKSGAYREVLVFSDEEGQARVIVAQTGVPESEEALQ